MLYSIPHRLPNTPITQPENGLPSTGIPYVLVNGTIVVRESQVLKDVFSGQPIRFLTEEKGRFVPVSGETWLKTYTIKTNPPSIDIDDSVLNPPANE
ncbi:MAG: hypothetical protein R3F53_15185 [Gammaproteobacteria bacterium]